MGRRRDPGELVMTETCYMLGSLFGGDADNNNKVTLSLPMALPPRVFCPSGAVCACFQVGWMGSFNSDHESFAVAVSFRRR